MCKKLIYSACFVLVLGLVLTSAAEAADPDLAGHWKLDETSGTTAFDSSGNGNDGVVNGGALWVAGQLGGAMQFNGSDSFVAAPHIPLNSRSFTITMWVNPVLSGDQVVFGQVQTNATNTSMHFRITGNGTVRMGFYSNDLDTVAGTVADNNWYHITFWYDFENQTRRIYMDGVQTAEDNGGPYLGTSGDTRIGQWNNNQWFQGMIDDVRIYHRPLLEPEINAVMQGSGTEFPFASNPVPADGSLYTDTWATLTWRAGDFAVSHDVYLGDNFDDVNDGTTDSPVFRGNLDKDTTMLIVGFFGFPYPDGLVPGTTYYWRIDEINDANVDSPWKGDVWSFSVPPRKAYGPDPADGATYIDPDVTLSWTEGFGAKLHYVYFGDNFDDVNSATGGQLVTSTSYTPGTLEVEKTYYWRIDESDGVTTYTGDVWSFTTLPDIPITDPNLVGWWKFDEGSGAIALDRSGHGNHGTLQGDSKWVAGYDGEALEFDGTGDYVDCGNGADLTITGDITLMCWIKVAAFSKTWETIVAKGDNSYRMSRGPGDGDSIHFGCNGPSGGNLNAATIVTTDTWRHAALVYDGSNKIVYIDGFEDARVASTGSINVSSYNLFIGENSQARNRHLTGLVDDVRLYNKVLTPDEIKDAMRGDTTVAGLPSPSNGSTADIFAATTLTWSPGDNAAQHDVYFGTDRAAVDAADTSDTTGVYRGRQGLTSYTPPEGIQMNTGPYYWRIDEFNTDGTISTGRVWSFTVGDYGLVEDFESYNDIPATEPGSNLVYLTWIDGYDNPATNGSTMGYPTGPSMETDTVHGGRQSAPVLYSNVAVSISEVERTFAVPQNWTVHGLTTLSLCSMALWPIWADNCT
jgi:hypothetical protein